MKDYSEYTKQYVQDICNALNEAGVKMGRGEDKKPFSPNNFESLTNFLQKYIVMSLDIFTFLDQKGLVNRGRCPYTGQKIDKSFPKWTYMNSRSVYVSHDGYALMRKEDDEDYEKVMGHPRPQKKTGGCYIATVCYGSDVAPEVLLFKDYRDKVLMPKFFGRLFIKFYYSVSPTIADFLRDKPRINGAVKGILDFVITKIK